MSVGDLPRPEVALTEAVLVYSTCRAETTIAAVLQKALFGRHLDEFDHAAFRKEV